MSNQKDAGREMLEGDLAWRTGLRPEFVKAARLEPKDLAQLTAQLDSPPYDRATAYKLYGGSLGVTAAGVAAFSLAASPALIVVSLCAFSLGFLGLLGLNQHRADHRRWMAHEVKKDIEDRVIARAGADKNPVQNAALHL